MHLLRTDRDLENTAANSENFAGVYQNEAVSQ